jgi:hypothetical protein
MLTRLDCSFRPTTHESQIACARHPGHAGSSAVQIAEPLIPMAVINIPRTGFVAIAGRIFIMTAAAPFILPLMTSF